MTKPKAKTGPNILTPAELRICGRMLRGISGFAETSGGSDWLTRMRWTASLMKP